MLYGFLWILIEVALVIHVLKTGRAHIWIWLVLFIPVAGGLAYFILEILPELMGSRTGRKAARKFESLVNPDKELNQALADYEIAQTTENAIRLADAYMAKQEFAKARDLYRKSLRGLHANDPHIMFCLARAEFGLNQYADTKQILDDLIKQNPDYKNADAHLLYARSLEFLNNIPAALHEYETLDDYYPGPEASYHYAQLLIKQGRSTEAQAVLRKILTKAKTSGSYYRDFHKEWIKLARAAYQGVDV